jgi:transposase InsO family protein
MIFSGALPFECRNQDTTSKKALPVTCILSHYRWHDWIKRIDEVGLIRSMSRKGCYPRNSACKGFFGMLKNGLFYWRSWRRVSIDEFIRQLD